jgi:hypothetical protein
LFAYTNKAADNLSHKQIEGDKMNQQTERKRGAINGNSYAMIDETPRDAILNIRCTKEDKALFYAACNGGKLSKWIIETLKKEAMNTIV